MKSSASHGKNVLLSEATKLPVVLQATGLHQRLDAETVVELDVWLDQRLDALESRFQHFITSQTFKRSLERR